MNLETERLLWEADWATLHKLLTAHALNRSWRYPKRTDDTEELGLGQTVHDVVQSVITKTISGERQWDPELGPLLPWLKDQVNSLMDHLFQSWNYRYETDLETRDPQGQIVIETAVIERRSHNAGLASQTPNPEQALLQKQVAQQRVGLLFQAADDDPDLQSVVEAMLDGCPPKPQALADELHVSVEDIYRRLRKLRRRVAKLPSN